MIRLLLLVVCLLPLALTQISCSSCDSDKDIKDKTSIKADKPYEPPKETKVTVPEHMDESLEKAIDVDLQTIGEKMFKKPEELPKVNEKYSIGPEGFGSFPACFSELELLKNSFLRSCPFTDIATDYHCFTFDKTKEKNKAMLEMWCKGGKLVRILVRNPNFKTIHGLSTKDDLLSIRSTYKEYNYFRSDNNQWVVNVPIMNMNYYLDDNNSESSDKIDRFTRISSIEVLFNCNGKEAVTLPETNKKEVPPIPQINRK